ncbi:MAG: hypothetical protein PHS54_05080 [Clostridia bacterium]|nr:hypothetical protein [Clostridia bacterium]
MRKNKFSEKEINKALYKRAIGYEVSEVVEEYSVDESGEYALNKKKVTKKHISPDLSAAKLLLEKYSNENDSEIKEMTKEELLQKKLELIEMLKKKEKIEE